MRACHSSNTLDLPSLRKDADTHTHTHMHSLEQVCQLSQALSLQPHTSPEQVCQLSSARPKPLSRRPSSGALHPSLATATPLSCYSHTPHRRTTIHQGKVARPALCCTSRRVQGYCPNEWGPTGVGGSPRTQALSTALGFGRDTSPIHSRGPFPCLLCMHPT